MREIEFRAFQIVTKTMFYNIQKGTGTSYTGLPPFADYLENKSMIIMQYTGLKDKNGKKIYEGDILKQFDNIKDIYKVIIPNFFYLIGDGYIQEDCCELIGNIYENPELLEEVK